MTQLSNIWMDKLQEKEDKKVKQTELSESKGFIGAIFPALNLNNPITPAL